MCMYTHIYIYIYCKDVINNQCAVYEAHAHEDPSENGTCAGMGYSCIEPIPSVHLAQDPFASTSDICMVAERVV